MKYLTEYFNRKTKGSFASAAIVLGFLILTQGKENPVCLYGGAVVFYAGIVSLLVVLYYSAVKFRHDVRQSIKRRAVRSRSKSVP